MKGGKILTIKPVIQSDIKDCGVCAMEWIINYYDGYIPLEKLREDTYTTQNGTTAYHLVKAFQKWNFDSMGVLEKDITSPKLDFPLIAHFKLENGLEHFVVVKKIIKNTIYLMDPSIGNKKLTIANFNKLFTGHLILAYPRSKIIKMAKDTPISKLFLNIINKEKFLVLKIIISSLFLTFLVIISSYYLKIGSSLIDQDKGFIKYIIIVFLIITLLKLFMLYVRGYYENHLNNLIDCDIFPMFINHLFFIPLKNIQSRTTGDIMMRVNELSNIKSLFSDIFISCFLDSMMVFASMIILFIISKELSFILFGFIILYLIIGFIISKLTYDKILQNIDYHTNFHSKLIEFINMLGSLKHLNIINIFKRKIEYVLSAFLLSNYYIYNFFNKTNLIKEFIIESCFFIINSIGIYKVVIGKLNIINLFTFNILLSYFIDPIRNMINLLPKYNYVKVSFSKIREFLSIEEEKLKEDDITLNGDLIFKNVSYSYNNYNDILTNVNLIIKKNSHVLLNGKSGSGKSTICKLLYKEIDNFRGNIYYGNKNYLDLNLNDIRKHILYISQDEELFFGTIKENILAGRDINEDDFNKVCNLAMVEDIINNKKMRYTSLIEPSLNNLSGGEKQRIILARGLLKDAKILIFDEALSEVDILLERKIIKNIRSYYQDRTIIYISHKNQKKSFENIIEMGDINGLF